MPRTVTIQGKDRTEHDLTCPECGAPMKLKCSRYGLFYGCSSWQDTGCEGSHGAHPDGAPRGVPANRATKDARIEAHRLFDRIWGTGLQKRTAAYRWMREAMGMTPDEAHIGRFSIEDCERLLGKIRAAFPELCDSEGQEE